MIIDIPQQNPLQQLNKGDLKGSIKETFNVDLSLKPNKICLPNKTIINVTDSDIASLGIISDFVFFDGTFHALSVGQDSGTYAGDGRLFRGGDAVDDAFTLPTWTVNTTDFDPTATAIVYRDELIYHSDDTWSLGTGSDTSFTSESTTGGGPFSVVFQDRAYFTGASNTIYSYTDPATISTTGSYTFKLPDNDLEYSGLVITSNNIWIPTVNKGGGNAKVYSWDGVTENTFDGEYEIPDVSVLSICVKDNIPHITTGSGKVLAFNGSYFEEVAEFPFRGILLARNAFEGVSITDAQGKWIHNRGMEVIDDKIHFLVSPIANLDSTIYGDYSKLAGIWCLDPEIGLYHRYAISISATNGEQGQVKHVGALKKAPRETVIAEGEHGAFIFSFSYFTANSTSTEKYAIGYAEPQASADKVGTGYITTNRIYSPNLQDSWEKVCLGFEDMNSADSIITKYRRIEKDAFNVGITWASATSYTSTDSNLATVKTNFEAGINYESRILYGDGAGVFSQITNITENAGTYTITVDTSHTQTPTNTAVARLENWEKVDTITNADNNVQFKQIPIGKESNWIQYKFVLNGTEVALNKHNPVINRIVSVSSQHTKFQ